MEGSSLVMHPSINDLPHEPYSFHSLIQGLARIAPPGLNPSLLVRNQNKQIRNHLGSSISLELLSPSSPYPCLTPVNMVKSPNTYVFNGRVCGS